jgi:enoyl-CoA hydratase
MPGTVLVRDVAAGIRGLCLTNPSRRNAIDPPMLEALETALADDADVRVWLLSTTGEHLFSAGYDLTQLGGFPEGTALPDEKLGQVLDLLSNHPCPSVAVVQGPAIGAGCELAAACDFRVGSDAACFTMPPAKLGVVYSLKGLARLQSRVGAQATRRMFLLGRTVDALEAEGLGLLDVRSPKPHDAAAALCAELAGHAPLALRGMKQGLRLLETTEPLAHQDYERLRREAFNSADALEGVSAALAKRAPRFTGR